MATYISQLSLTRPLITGGPHFAEQRAGLQHLIGQRFLLGMLFERLPQYLICLVTLHAWNSPGIA
ncbi:hypothetical protein BLL36_29045 [Pseudomonas cedrina subsp. cedrina]|uniref:Uncharacterized protein n=1 Tax=Pseudomonas cedrina subsp. cedrina TaxID=76762 RepID=A0A1V2JVK4_PSECE|nr:hypothetical protein BLL36_29045 [Pseudomonas cedrina subsp. cedrina]